MGREFSRHELLVEASAAAPNSVSSDRAGTGGDSVTMRCSSTRLLSPSVAGHSHHRRRDTDDA